MERHDLRRRPLGTVSTPPPGYPDGPPPAFPVCAGRLSATGVRRATRYGGPPPGYRAAAVRPHLATARHPVTARHSGYGPAARLRPATGYGAPPGYGPPPGSQYGPPPLVPGMVPGAVKPGIIPLRPLTLSDIFNGAVGYIRANPKATLGLTAMVVVIMQIISLAATLGPLAAYGRIATQRPERADLGRHGRVDDVRGRRPASHLAGRHDAVRNAHRHRRAGGVRVADHHRRNMGQDSWAATPLARPGIAGSRRAWRLLSGWLR